MPDEEKTTGTVESRGRVEELLRRTAAAFSMIAATANGCET
jgi:hypothetical protein